MLDFTRALPFIGALLLIGGATLVGVMPSPDFPFDPRVESLGLGGTIAVVAALLLYCAIAFFLRPLRPPPGPAVATAAPAAVLVACVAALGVWIANPYLGLLVAIGLQAWLIAAARPADGRLAATGLVLLGLIPLVALAGNLAGRFDAGLGVWQDLLLMLADGQISVALALLGCLLAGSGVAIVATAGGARADRAGEIRIEQGGEISVQRHEHAAEPEPEEVPEPPPGPAQPEPERDPRLWSKPPGSSSPPPGRRRLTPRPSVT
jgi:hypothetical protein